LLRFPPARSTPWLLQTKNSEGQTMPSLKVGIVNVFDDLREGGLARPAAEKFAGAWLACFLVMARGNILAAFSLDHALLASVCGIVGALVTVALLAQMDRTIDSVARQATISAIATFVGDVFAHPSHFGPQWAEPVLTAGVSAAIAIAVWHAKRWARSL
jgi:hypothetical protein